MLSPESFKASDIVSHFNQLKAAGKEQWWNGYVSFEWSKIRPGKNSTKWLTIRYTNDLSIKPRRLIVIIRDEVHSGQIKPTTQEDLAELRLKNPEAKLELRTMKPSLQFQKWTKQVQTQEDKITPLIDDQGNYIYPDDSYLSNYYQVAYYLDEIFKYEMRRRVDRGMELMMAATKNKTFNVKDIKDNVGHVNDCDTIITDDNANNLRELLGDKYTDFMKGVLIVSSNKVGTIIQERISEKAIKNKGAKLPNPMTRITIPFELKPGPTNVTILDKSKQFTCNGKRGYKPATYKDEPVNANNIHWFIPSRSIIDGIVSMDSVCFSQLGISLPVKITLLIVQQPIKRENNVLSLCSEIYGDMDDLPAQVPESDVDTLVDELIE